MDRDDTNIVTMPKWPAWIMLATMALSAYPALTASAPTAQAASVEVTRVPAIAKPAARTPLKAAPSAKALLAAN